MTDNNEKNIYLIANAITTEPESDTIVFRDAIEPFIKYKWLFFTTWLGIIIIGCLIALILSPVYTASVKVMYAQNRYSNGGGTRISTMLGGAGSLLNLNLPRETSETKKLEILKSRKIAYIFIEAEDIHKIIFNTNWDDTTQKLNSNSNKARPALLDTYKAFENKIKTIGVDNRSGLITISMTWKDPVIAANWANSFIRIANMHIRNADLMEAQQSIKYLEDQISKTTIQARKEMLYRLVEAEEQKIVSTQASDEYAFNVIDPAIVPDAQDNMRRYLTILLAVALGLLLGCTAVFIAYKRANRNVSK